MSVMAMPARITQARRKWSERTMNVRQPVTARFELGPPEQDLFIRGSKRVIYNTLFGFYWFFFLGGGQL